MSTRDRQFAEWFVQRAGHFVAENRINATVRTKGDGTPVTNIDEDVNVMFVSDVRSYTGRRVSIVGEEFSSTINGADLTWVIDPIDGTEEYASSMPDKQRTSCVAVALLKKGVVMVSAVYNPFTNELLSASREEGVVRLNGRRLLVNVHLPFAGGLPYDYSTWRGAKVNTANLSQVMKRPRRGAGSAIWQACEVARNRNAFAAFPGNKLHDIAPSALIVEMAGGVVTDARGGDVMSLNGAIYAVSADVHAEVVRMIA